MASPTKVKFDGYMFKKTSTKIFLGFSFLVIIQVAVLSFYFGKLVVRESKTSILEMISSRSQLAASQVKFNKKGEPQTIALVKSDGEILDPQLRSEFPRELIKPLIPAAGSVVTECHGISGEKYICAFAPVAGRTYWVFDYTTDASLSAIIQKLLKNILSIAAAFILGGLALTYALSRFLLAPLRKFFKATQLVAEGSYESIELPLQRRDEIGGFAKAFKKMIGVIQDREKNLKIAGMKLAHSTRLATIGQMGASIAHEVKNPLTAMMGYAKVIKSKISDPHLIEAAEIIQSEGERCNQILQQMLRFARNDPTENKPYALKEVIQSAALLLKAEAKTQHIDLKVEADTDAVVVGSAQQIQQVLLNLLLNAIHASAAGNQVNLRVKNLKDEVAVEIEDYGSGIPKEIQSRIFEPFFTTKSKKEGTGLGLSVAQEIIHNQSGSLNFESEEGKGTTFEIRLKRV